MPLDPRIILGAAPAPQAMPPFDPFQAAGNVFKFQHAQQAQQLNQLQLAEAQRAEQERGTMARAFQDPRVRVTDPATGMTTVDVPKAFGLALGTSTNPLGILKARGEYTKAQAEADKITLEAKAKQLDGALNGLKIGAQVAQGIEARIASGMDPQRSWELGIAEMDRAGLPTAQIPKFYDAQSLSGWKAQAVSREEQLKAEREVVSQQLREREVVQTERRTDLEAKKLPLEERRVKVQEEQERRLATTPDPLAETRELQRQKLKLDIAQAERDASGVLSPADQRKVSLDLRQNIRQEPSFKIFSQVRNGVQNVEVGASRNDSQGDLAIVNGYAKILDPEGVVRPEEFKTVEASQGFFDRLLNYPGKIWDGDRLRPPVRQRFLEAAQQLGKEKQTTAQKELSTVYEPLARDAGLDFGQLLPLELSQGLPGTSGGAAGGPAGSKKRVPEAMVEQLARERAPNATGADFAREREAVRQQLRDTGQYEVD